MPTYAYACTECDHRFDAQQSFSDAALTECPQCSGRLRKLFGSVGVVFKGSGFYRTDSRESGRKASAGAEKGAATKAEKSTDSATPAAPSNGSAASSPAAPSSGTPAKTAAAG